MPSGLNRARSRKESGPSTPPRVRATFLALCKKQNSWKSTYVVGLNAKLTPFTTFPLVSKSRVDKSIQVLEPTLPLGFVPLPPSHSCDVMAPPQNLLEVLRERTVVDCDTMDVDSW